MKVTKYLVNFMFRKEKLINYSIIFMIVTKYLVNFMFRKEKLINYSIIFMIFTKYYILSIKIFDTYHLIYIQYTHIFGSIPGIA